MPQITKVDGAEPALVSATHLNKRQLCSHKHIIKITMSDSPFLQSFKLLKYYFYLCAYACPRACPCTTYVHTPMRSVEAIETPWTVVIGGVSHHAATRNPA